jgi:hypothetical protein
MQSTIVIKRVILLLHMTDKFVSRASTWLSRPMPRTFTWMGQYFYSTQEPDLGRKRRTGTQGQTQTVKVLWVPNSLDSWVLKENESTVDEQRIAIDNGISDGKGKKVGMGEEPALRKKASIAANPASPPTWSSLPTMLINWLGCQTFKFLSLVRGSTKLKGEWQCGGGAVGYLCPYWLGSCGRRICFTCDEGVMYSALYTLQCADPTSSSTGTSYPHIWKDTTWYPWGKGAISWPSERSLGLIVRVQKTVCTVGLLSPERPACMLALSYSVRAH